MTPIRTITKTKLLQPETLATMKPMLFQCHSPPPNTVNGTTKSTKENDSTNATNDDAFTLYVSKDKKFKLIVVVFVCCIVSFLLGGVVNRTTSYYNKTTNNNRKLQQPPREELLQELQLNNNKNINDKGTSNSCSSSHDDSSASSCLASDENNIDLQIYYETLIHPGMMLWLQEKQYQTKQPQNQPPPNKHDRMMMNVAIIDIQHHSKDKYNNINKMFVREVLKYQNVQNIFLVSIIAGDNSSNNSGDTIQTEECYNNINDNRQSSSCLLHRITIHIDSNKNKKASSLLSTLLQSTQLSQLSSPPFDVIVLTNEIQQYIIHADNDDVDSSIGHEEGESHNTNDLIPNIVTNLLRPDGVLISPMGPVTKSMYTYVPSMMFHNDNTANNYNDHDHPPQKHVTSITIANIIEKCDFHSILQYSESVTSVSNQMRRHLQPYQFIIAKKDTSLSPYRMSMEAETMLAIRKAELMDIDINNINYTDSNDYKSNNLPYVHFDAATMQTYAFPSHVMEDMWCLDENSSTNETDYCFRYQTFDPSIPDLPTSAFQVKTSTVANGGRGVYSVNHVPKGAYIGLRDAVHGMFVPPLAYALLKTSSLQVEDYTPYFDCILDGYLTGYGWVENLYGRSSAGVDPGIFTFANHGCNGTNNIGAKMDFTERSLEYDSDPQLVFDDDVKNDLMMVDLELIRQFPGWSLKAAEDIQPEEELLDNYLLYGGLEYFEGNLRELKAVCSGARKYGSVSEYEIEKQRQQHEEE